MDEAGRGGSERVRQPGDSGDTPLERSLGWFLVVLMGISVLNVLWQIFTRFVLSSPSSYTEELARYLLIWIGLIGSAYASAKGLHLAIDLLSRRLGSSGPGKALSISIEVIVVVFAGVVLVVGGSRLVALMLELGQTSPALGIPMGWVYAALPISGLLMVWFSFRRIGEILRTGGAR